VGSTDSAIKLAGTDRPLPIMGLVPRYGDNPRPRTLVIGFPPETVAAIAGVVPTVRSIELLGEVEQAEHDLAVVRGSVAARLNPALFSIVCGDPDRNRTDHGGVDGARIPSSVVRVDSPRASIFEIPDAVDSRIAVLVRKAILPVLLNSPNHTMLEAEITGYAGASGRWGQDAIEPWITDSVGRIMAGAFLRSGRASICWSLPEFVNDVAPWVAAARDVWSTVDPERFPPASEWTREPRWQSSKESRLVLELTDLATRHIAALAEFEAEFAELNERLQRAQNEADQGERRLLTAQGDDLKAAVAGALVELGFVVTDADTTTAKPGDLLEDLRVTVAGDASWICLAEVRGYAHGGARTSDLGRIGRFSERFVRKHGNPPTCCWYIVNQFAETDPSTRPVPLVSNPDDVEIFREADGAVIDTRVLFGILADLHAGRLAVDEARETLRGARGRVSYDRRTV
jgi:hypothetical protein